VTVGLLGLSRRAAGARSVGNLSGSAQVSQRGLGGASSGRAVTGPGGREQGGEPAPTPLPRAVAMVRLSTPRGPPCDMCDIDDTVMGGSARGPPTGLWGRWLRVARPIYRFPAVLPGMDERWPARMGIEHVEGRLA